MGFNQPATLVLPASTPVAMAVFRQATYPVWADQSATLAYVVDYGVAIMSATLAAASEIVLPTRCLVGWSITNRAAAAVYVGVAGASSTWGGMWPLLGAEQGGVELTYVPAGAAMKWVIANATPVLPAATITVNYEIWSSPGEFSTDTAQVVLAAGNTGTATVSAYLSPFGGVWVRPTSIVIAGAGSTAGPAWVVSLAVFTGTAAYTPSAVNAGVLTITPAAATMFIPLCQPVEFANSALPWYATRVTAAAVLGTNVSQVLNKGGTVLGGRISPSVVNPFTCPMTYINGLHPAEKAYLPLETGVYTYAPPSTDLVFFGDYTLNTASGAGSAPLFRLDNDSMVNKMFITATAVTEQLACTCTWHVEFRTSSALFQIGLCAMTLESLHTAQLVLAEAGFFFENPEHDSLLGKVVGAAKKYLPGAVGLVNPTAGRVLSSVVSKMSLKPKNGPSKPQATSAKASGITGGGKQQKQKQKDGKKNKGKGKGKK